MKIKSKKLLDDKDIMQEFGNEPIPFNLSQTNHERVENFVLQRNVDYFNSLTKLHKKRVYSFYRLGTILVNSFEELEYHVNQPVLTSTELNHLRAGAESILDQIERTENNEVFVHELQQLYSGIGTKKIPCEYIFFNPKDKSMYVSRKANIITKDFEVTSSLEGISYSETTQSSQGTSIYNRLTLEIGIAKLVETIFARPTQIVSTGELASETDDKRTS